MKKILNNITDYISNWWQNVDKRFLFWGVIAALAVVYSIYKN
jgi:hypothetical protein